MNEEIKELLLAKDYERVAASVRKPEEAARILNEMADEDVVPFCRELESDFLAEVLVLLDPPLQQKIVSGLSDDESRAGSPRRTRFSPCSKRRSSPSSNPCSRR